MEYRWNANRELPIEIEEKKHFCDEKQQATHRSTRNSIIFEFRSLNYYRSSVSHSSNQPPLPLIRSCFSRSFSLHSRAKLFQTKPQPIRHEFIRSVHAHVYSCRYICEYRNELTNETQVTFFSSFNYVSISLSINKIDCVRSNIVRLTFRESQAHMAFLSPQPTLPPPLTVSLSLWIRQHSSSVKQHQEYITWIRLCIFNMLQLNSNLISQKKKETVE